MKAIEQTVSVIVSKCNLEGTAADDRVSEERFASVPAAIGATELLRGKGVCVIVRPNYNEVRPTMNGHVRYFREWRSFNGEPFRECRWEF